VIAITFWSFLGLRLRQASEGKPLPVKKEGRQFSGPVKDACANSSSIERPRPFLQIVAHNLKLAANIDHMRDDTSNAPSQPRPPSIVPEHRGNGLVRQRGLSVYPSVFFKFNTVRIDCSDRSECLASGTFGVDHAMTLKFDMEILDLSQVHGVDSGDGRTVDEIYRRNQYAINIQAVIPRQIQVPMWGV